MVEVVETPYGEVLCGRCGYSLECNEYGDMPDVCPECGEVLNWEEWDEQKHDP